ncbi:T-Cell Surface Glycoprotein Cd5 [Manis pentadactyla]|nr:T-Cell Surface Glycoprotein Cd5 [Manis pentadactyla]
MASYKQDAVKFSYVNQGIPRHVPMDKACDRRDQDWVRIQFTETGKKTEVSRWIKGLKWGIKYYKYGGHGEHEGSVLTIKLAVSSPSTAVRPNPVTNPQTPSIQDKGLGQRDEKMSTGRTPEPHARLSSRGALAGTNSYIRRPTTGTHAPDPPVVVAGAVAVIAMGRVVGAAIAWPTVALLVAVALVPGYCGPGYGGSDDSPHGYYGYGPGYYYRPLSWIEGVWGFVTGLGRTAVLGLDTANLMMVLTLSAWNTLQLREQQKIPVMNHVW